MDHHHETKIIGNLRITLYDNYIASFSLHSGPVFDQYFVYPKPNYDADEINEDFPFSYSFGILHNFVDSTREELNRFVKTIVGGEPHIGIRNIVIEDVSIRLNYASGILAVSIIE